MKNAQQWIDELQLTEHPEGGYYKETVRENNNQRAPFSSIYFLLTHDNISHFHRIDADEVWYYHAGDSLTVHMITPEGDYRTAQLGPNIQNGDVLQFLVPKGTIFASSVEQQNDYCLVGCMCQPAFEFEHFELFEQQQLIDMYPHLTQIIQQYALKEK
ncbi:cupin domain-containing protein [Staphylococcus simiae]|uniref:cupin domain-containing protein n=1 Tax=Staphylococcus simiae TaxID=308354 RepID=UPI001A96AB07|nr:cupin domain-containing protein [Staphylococcus simiae]MBO1198846.1 cupin domain-containing protein [Staphylococcus simiae]MBO1201043.1 cupin domain-containing protein [Staphylococcus simiae]MBO1204036.1 cupin domain-containing protein [Staphylococcus simiae]MBO1211083.1 cupin domain-containing protein [Staphylococcus simiae]MBO1229364.1 cupin domain-containing protein [Staphylococcus simiae]